MSLRVLVSLQQQVDQSRDGTCLPKWCLIGWAQGEVPDQANRGLRRGRGGDRDIKDGSQRDVSVSMWVSFKAGFSSVWQRRLLFRT